MELPQSGAIIRHLARENGAYGDSAKEAAQIDMLREKFVDMREAILKLIFIGDEAEYVSALFFIFLVILCLLFLYFSSKYVFEYMSVFFLLYLC